MIRSLKVLFALIAVFSVVSCASVSKTETNKSPGYNEVIAKLFVVVDTGDTKVGTATHSNLSEYIETVLKKKFSAMGITIEVGRETGLELDTDHLTKEINDFGGTTMVIQLASGETMSGVLVRGTFDTSILDKALKSKVWAAKLTGEQGSWLNGAIWIDTIIDNIIAALRKDGLITAPEPQKT